MAELVEGVEKTSDVPRPSRVHGSVPAANELSWLRGSF